MKPVSLTLIASAVSVLLSAGMASAQAQSVSTKMSESPNLWFVEFAGAPTADGRRIESVKADEAQFLNEASNLNIKFKKHNTFTHLFNGVSIEVSPQERARLAKMKSVKAMYPVMVIDAPKVEKTDGGSAADMATALGMTGADIVQNTLGYTGAGIKVGVIDTGIDLDHPAFGGGGVPGGTPFAGHPRVKYGYDFVGDAFQAGGVPQPDDNPDDCAGHGTHVAGIIGGNTETFKGVAPGVTFGAYRVFGCTGSTTSDIILAAMERAKADGMQVINQSLGASYQWPQYPTAQAADRLVRDGIVVVASIGNCGIASTSCGAGGLYGAGAPGVGANVIGVASYENVGLRLQSLTAGSDGKAFGFQDATGAAATPTSGTFPLARTGSVTKVDDACAALPAGSLTGKVALIRRGTCSFYQKASNAQAAGAAGVILYNNVPGFLGATVAGTPAITIPVVATSDQQGAELDTRAATGSETITWTSNVASFNNPLGGLISSFSSWGLAADLSLKPDVGAPGGMIYSSYPLEGGGWATLSGTSMSSPHTAGAVALFLQARPGTPAATVRDRFQNAADPKMWQGNPGLGMLDATHRQGAGMIDIPQTIQAKTYITPGKLSLGESQAGPATRTLTVRNPSRTPVTYTISHVGAAATGANSFTVSTYNIAATAAFSTTSLTVPANGSASVDVTVTAPAALPDKGIYGGYVVFTNTSDNSTWRVPYSGFKGDYQSIQVMAPTANGFPWLAKLVGTSYQKQPTGASYSLQSGDMPYFLVHFDHHARTFRMKVREAVSGKTWWDAAKDDYIPRQSTATGFYAFNWDGTTRRPNGDLVTVPNGDYIVDVMVLKALGDANNDADWEVWASPKVTLARPAPTH